MRNANRDSNSNVFTVFHHHLLLHLNHQSVLPKGRSLTANLGTKAAVLPKAGLPLQTQEPRLQFY